MSLWQVVRNIILGHVERWDPEQDETLLYLSAQTDLAKSEATRLRRQGIPLTGNIIEDNATGAASRYRKRRIEELR